MQADQAKYLRQISDGLNDVQNTLRSGSEAGCSQSQRGHFSKCDVDCLQKKLKSLSLSEKDVINQQSILESLEFESRPVRHTQIAAPHEETFKWALTTDTDQDPSLGPSIGTWLRHGEGVFWVSGKPGSGKSTLMKYIADSSITSRFINEWARPCRAAIVSHYFWATGTSMQKSQQGLLQTLIYEIFRQYPDLIKQTCGKRWNSSQSDSWSLADLQKVLQTFAKNSHADLKLCFIIDGLDEYSGDHEDRTRLCRTLKDLAVSGKVKLCLSSRPWNIFEEEFGLESPKIYMQDLTRDGIQEFVSSRLKEHKRWAAVSAKYSQGQWLISEIAAKSNGVFLWIFLVTKLLREGLTNRDAFVDLRRRLESFPSEIEPFFKAMLEAVEPFYGSHMSTALQIANASTEGRWSYLIYSFHFKEYEDSDYSINQPIGLMSQDEIEEIRSNTSWHLDSRTRGLLEVNPCDGTVGFLHRTVRDFLNTQEMYDFLIAKADPRLNFRPSLSILKAHIAMIKTSPVPDRLTRKGFGNFDMDSGSGSFDRHDRRPHVSKLLLQALGYVKEMKPDTTGDIRHRVLLDELDRSLICMLSKSNCEFVPSAWSNMKHAFLREQLVQLGIFDYLRSKLDSDPAFLKSIGTLPVLRFLTPDPNNDFQLKRGRGFDVLTCLLDNDGIDTNREDDCESLSPWKELFTRICHWWNLQRKPATLILSFLLEKEIFKLFLKAGADPGALIIAPSTTSETYSSRAATTAYLEFCFDVLDHSPPTQRLYLDVLSEFLRLSKDEVLQDVTDVFCTVLSYRDKNELHWNLPFLAKVNDILRLSLVARGPEIADSLSSLDQMGKRVFPLSLYAPINAAKEPRRNRRKQENGSGRKRKNQREA